MPKFKKPLYPVMVAASLFFSVHAGIGPAIAAPDIKVPTEVKIMESKLSGTVSYPQRIALPPDATIVVRLEDIARADAPSTVIAEEKITTGGQQVPIPFALNYDRSRLETRGRYAVRAQIFYGDRLRWTTTRIYPVNAIGEPEPVNLVVEPVR